MKRIYTLLFTAFLVVSSYAFGMGLHINRLQEDFDRDTPCTLDRLKAQGFTNIETSVTHFLVLRIGTAKPWSPPYEDILDVRPLIYREYRVCIQCGASDHA